MLLLILQIFYSVPVALGATVTHKFHDHERALDANPPAYRNHAQAFAGTQAIVSADDPEIKPPEMNGNFVLVNQCEYDLYMWEAWTMYQTAEPILVPARTSFRKELVSQYKISEDQVCIDNCGVTYKISKTKELIGGDGGNQMQFEYSTKLGEIYFDISFVDCVKNLGYRSGDANNCPAWAEGLRIDGQKEPHSFGCEMLECLPGEMCIYDQVGAYYIDEPNPKWGLRDPVKICPSYKAALELYFRTCTGNPDLDQ
ncbi:hypothetical protein BU23DRAFT_522436 [Bimuria novae-zelandiae CBS 107.79]|uniref:Uncharacterized protein n=1 Tax=Bimuria novae-zelandiae CBS 107.79 TaxID=1447943 RepID=A0A6A5VUF1_9PLEO|nr:hypothetical protein BU23DRAFT_522436 [Bimuria novae-zelandiae CBS 107.79]